MASEFDVFRSQCQKTVEHYKKELGRVRSGRATTSLLEGIMVDYYGTMCPLQQMGLVAAPEPRLLTIQVYDGGAVDNVEKAIRQSELGLNPAREGSLIRVAIPALNEERRKELIKKLHKMTEENRVTLRNHRRDAVEAIKKKGKNKEISEDDSRKGQEEIQKILDKHIAEIDAALAAKEKEMLEV